LTSDYIIRITALSVALDLALKGIADMSGADAQLDLEA
jgi:hypothetical protein